MSISASAPMNESMADTDGPWLLTLSLEYEFTRTGAFLLATGLKGTMLMRPIDFGRLTELSSVGVTLREEGDEEHEEEGKGPSMIMEILLGRDIEAEESVLTVAVEEEPVLTVEAALRNEGRLQKSGSDLDVFFVDLGYGCFL